MDSDVDFERLAERIRTHSVEASGSDTGRVTMRDLDGVDPESLRGLLEALDGDIDPGDCSFHLSPTNAERAAEGLDDGEDMADRLGRPVEVEESMPDDTVLLMDPDAIDGGEIVEPSAVVCGTVRGD